MVEPTKLPTVRVWNPDEDATTKEAALFPGEAWAHRQAMLTARRIVEQHIETYGMVPHPDKLKEAIATKIASAAVGP
jgi:hypothetical protein